MQIPSKKYENIVIEQFEGLPEKEKKQMLIQIKNQILLHNN